VNNLLSTTPVVILAGGLGTRLQSVFPDLPKCMVRVGEKPFLQIQIELLKNQGAYYFVLCVGYMANKVMDYFGDGSKFGVSIRYSIEKEKLLGTGGALKLAGGFFTSRALALNGDTYLNEDYEKVLQSHFHLITSLKTWYNGVATMCTCRILETDKVLLDGSFVKGFVEKWINAGVYVIEQELLGSISANIVVSLERDILPIILQEERSIAAYKCSNQFFDIGTLDGLTKFEKFYKEKL
jgi:NDP-sugar pyrophosphorylase family protein